MIELLKIVVPILLFPFILYLSVKLGTYAFFRGKKLFHDEFGEKND